MKNPFKKALLLLLLVIAGWQPYVHAEGLPVVTDFAAEAKVSAEKQLPILVLFMSKSCSYCETVLNDFLLPMQRDREYDNRVILRQIDTESAGELFDFEGLSTTQRKFSRKHIDWGTPTVVLFDSSGNVLESIVGLLTEDFYLAFLNNAINGSLEKIRHAEKSLSPAI